VSSLLLLNGGVFSGEKSGLYLLNVRVRLGRRKSKHRSESHTLYTYEDFAQVLALT